MSTTHREILVPTFVKFIEQLAGDPESILDVGCGPLRASFRRYYGKRYKGLELKGSPYKKDLIGDAHEMSKLKDGSYDVVTGWSLLEHLHSPTQAIKEMTRIAEKIVIVSTDLTDADRDRDPTHLFCWTQKVLHQFLAQTGYPVHTWTERDILFGAVIKG